MIQIFLAVFGLSALWMSMGTANLTARRWAPVVGLCGQPFWLLATGGAEQWGMFALCCAYTAVYARGAWVQWRG